MCIQMNTNKARVHDSQLMINFHRVRPRATPRAPPRARHRTRPRASICISYRTRADYLSVNTVLYRHRQFPLMSNIIIFIIFSLFAEIYDCICSPRMKDICLR